MNQHLDIGLIDLLVIKTSQHSHTFGISWHKEQIRLIFLTCSEFGLQKQLVDFDLSSLYSQAQKTHKNYILKQPKKNKYDQVANMFTLTTMQNP